VVIYLLAITLAAAGTPSPAPPATPAPAAQATPIPLVTPGTFATPQSTQGLVLPQVPAVEPTFSAPSQQLPSGDIAGATGPFVGLSLDDAVSMALAHNTDLSLSQSSRRISGFAIVAAKGAYDLNFQVKPSYEVQVEAPVSPLNSGPGGGPITQITAGAQAGFSGNTSSGGSYNLFTSANRIDSNFLYDGYNPFYETALGFQFNQPLARNLAIDDNRRRLQIARIGKDLADDTTALQASNVVDNVLTAYYNLVSAWKNVAIQEDALLQAKSQSESNSRLVRRGAAAAVDVVESNTQVNEFQDDVYSAIQNVASQQNTLKQLLLGNPADPLWTANLVPTSPVSNEIVEPKIDDILVSALRLRPEVAQIRENIREEDVNLAYAKDQTKPQIDLNLGVTENGFSGSPQSLTGTPLFSAIGGQIVAINQLIARVNATTPGTPLVPLNPNVFNAPIYPGTIGKLSQSYATALRGEFPQYSIGATLSFPLQNRAANANYASERERRNELQTQEVALIQRLQYEARNAVQSYRSARSRLIAARAAREAAETVAESEVRKFKAGESTTFLVLQRQVTLANERGRELQAQTDLQTALVELDRVSGAILSNNNVDVHTAGGAPAGPVPAGIPTPAPAGH
jgi:HAE1 family hydrophobic/amphiphilic exporter-1